MPETSLLQNPRNRFFAFSAVGAAMVCLPLWQVLRYQQSELRQLAAERALLDPITQAVNAQFGLLAHRQVSSQLLHGRSDLEAARKAVQVGIDEHLQLLTQELTKGLWSHALAETRDLTRDWQQLARRVAARALSAAQSDHAHALRLEQAVQVMDLITVSDSTIETGQAKPDAGSRFAAAARLLTQLAHDLTPSAPAGEHAPTATAERTTAGVASNAAETGADASAQAAATAQARMLPRLHTLELALRAALAADQQRSGAAASATGTVASADPLAAALALADERTRAYLRAWQGWQPQSQPALRVARPLPAGHGPQPAEALFAEWQQTQQSLLAVYREALAQHRLALVHRSNQLQHQRAMLFAALALLSAAALALSASLLHRLHPAPPSAPVPRRRALPAANVDALATSPQPASASAGSDYVQPSATRVETARVMDRLRSRPRQPLRESDRPSPRETQDTLPPEHG